MMTEETKQNEASEQENVLWSILKQLKIGTEIRHLTIPPSFCEPRSLLERLSDIYSFPQILFA
jgi:hypothetical protein